MGSLAIDIFSQTYARKLREGRESHVGGPRRTTKILEKSLVFGFRGWA